MEYSKRLVPCMLIIVQSIFYAFGDSISKAAYEIMPVYSLLSVRYLIAVAFLMLVFGKTVVAGLRASSPKDWMLPSICIAAGYIAGNVALDLTAATSVAFLRQLLVVMTPILAYVVFRKKYRWIHLPVLALVVVGMYMLCGFGGLNGFGAGEIWSLICALLEAGALVFGEKALHNVNPLTLTTMQTAMSAFMAIVCAFIFEGGIHTEMATPSIWLVIVYLAVMCTVAGYFLQNVAMRKISASAVGLLQCSCPVMTAVFAFFILGERLNLVGTIGAIIILACVTAETFMQRKETE